MTLSEFRNSIFDNKQKDDKAVYKFLKEIDETQKALCRMFFESIEKGEVELEGDKMYLVVRDTPERRIFFNVPKELNIGTDGKGAV